MYCIGCDQTLEESPNVFAIFGIEYLTKLNINPDNNNVIANENFAASPVCQKCFIDPSNRNKVLKAHFSHGVNLAFMLKNAGSSGKIG